MRLPKDRFRKALAPFLMVVFLNGSMSCNYYYTYSSDSKPSIEKLDKLKNSPNYIIIHQADQAFWLTLVKVNQQEQIISGTLQVLSPDHHQYLETKPFAGSSNRYKKKPGGKSIATPYVVNEVHIYVNDLSLDEGRSLTIPLTSIEKIEVYDPDTGATTASFIFGGIGIAAAALGVITLVILLTKSSCPFVYVNNGEEYVFAGEIFSGAIFKSLERNDFLILPPLKESQTVELIISNKLKEQQFIDQLSLLQVSHPKGTRVLPDKSGTMHLIRNQYAVSKAIVNHENITSLLKSLDSIHFTFNSESGIDYFNEVTLTFPKPVASKEGHLVINAKNSLWGDYLFGEFTTLFGSSYMSWIKKQDNIINPKRGNWAADQGMAIKVLLELNGEWKQVGVVDMVGPLAFRDIIIPLDLTSHITDSIKIQLSAGFMFWDMDYVGIDYSKDEEMNAVLKEPISAITNDGKEVLQALMKSDGERLIQKNTGDEVTLTFSGVKSSEENLQNDFILLSRGYYHHVRDYSGATQVSTLLKFRQKGRLSQFSKEKFDEFNQLMQVAEISASSK